MAGLPVSKLSVFFAAEKPWLNIRWKAILPRPSSPAVPSKTYLILLPTLRLLHGTCAETDDELVWLGYTAYLQVAVAAVTMVAPVSKQHRAKLLPIAEVTGYFWFTSCTVACSETTRVLPREVQPSARCGWARCRILNRPRLAKPTLVFQRPSTGQTDSATRIIFVFMVERSLCRH